VEVKVVLANNEVPVKKVEKLLLHEVNLNEVEAKAFVSLDSSVTSPVLVLGR
jgi:hypothetical protein